jgi:hypothetical protein
MRRAMPMAKNVGAHSPTKIPQRSARSRPADSNRLDAAHEATVKPIEAMPAVYMRLDFTPHRCNVLIIISPLVGRLPTRRHGGQAVLAGTLRLLGRHTVEPAQPAGQGCI